MDVRFSVVGPGKLGASMAAAIANRGFYVIGVDVNQLAADMGGAGFVFTSKNDADISAMINLDMLEALRFRE
jgi:UDP-N-acetyl-D-mannosaminuronate dehydrogenase